MGLFVTFEGGDGSGKSTQAALLSERMRQRGLPVTFTREPGGTPLGEQVRELLKKIKGLSPLSELFLFQATRAQLVQQVLRPVVEMGLWVVCDRYADSSLAYQGYGRGLDLELVRRLNQQATEGIAPDLTVLLDIPVEEGFQRKGAAVRDRIEAEDWPFHERVRRGYLALARQEPDRWLVLDARLAPEKLHELVWQRVEPRLPASYPHGV